MPISWFVGFNKMHCCATWWWRTWGAYSTSRWAGVHLLYQCYTRACRCAVQPGGAVLESLRNPMCMWHTLYDSFVPNCRPAGCATPPGGAVLTSLLTLYLYVWHTTFCFSNPQACRLRYTPRRLLVVPDSRLLVVGEADHAAIPLAEREDLQVGAVY